MPAYAYPITINYGKQKVQTTKRTMLPDSAINLEQIKDIVGFNSFFLSYNADQHCIEIEWITYREETNEEQAARIAKEEAYMIKYNERQIK